ncbi:hypothetical protein C2845_PM09G15190 [Panicum miliaceum]|uniref:Uncharacterized protein n=1 Tax=Panicum miliaceum TaxID=4540 RepID=A0A3L6S1U6_PANMI|nr:hypothetical protein C2845_PM09G15190 [Panicum miliaceum]
MERRSMELGVVDHVEVLELQSRRTPPLCRSRMISASCATSTSSTVPSWLSGAKPRCSAVQQVAVYGCGGISRQLLGSGGDGVWSIRAARRSEREKRDKKRRRRRIGRSDGVRIFTYRGEFANC